MLDLFDSPFYRRYRNFFISILIILLGGITFSLCIQLLSASVFGMSSGDSRVQLVSPGQWPEVIVTKGDGKPIPTPTHHDCHYWSCFNVYTCGRALNQLLSIYVYPLTRYVDEEGVEIKPMSQEFYDILHTIINSEYYTPNPDEACIFVPPIDTLNENNLRKQEISQALASLPHWKDGENHLLFNMLPGTPPDFSTSLGVDRGSALIAGGGFSSRSYRRNFDVAIPVYNPAHKNAPVGRKPIGSRRWLVVSGQVNIHRDYREDLLDLAASDDDFLLLDKCPNNANLTSRCRGTEVYQYPEILTDAKFCLVLRGGRLGQAAFYDALKAGCIPIIVSDRYHAFTFMSKYIL
ncbi:unnamed protein product, partial [Meganyctiphanes norvegica]